MIVITFVISLLIRVSDYFLLIINFLVVGFVFAVFLFLTKKNMKANVKYNSYIGTAAADISESINLKQLLTESGYDGNRYEPLGLDLVLESGRYTVFAICIDRLNKESKDKNIAKCLLKNSEYSKLDKLFNHLNISLFASHLNPSDYASEDNKIVYLEGNIVSRQTIEPDINIDTL